MEVAADQVQVASQLTTLSLDIVEEGGQEILHWHSLKKIYFVQKRDLVLELAELWGFAHEVLIQKLVRCLSKDLLDWSQEGVEDVILYCKVLKLYEIVSAELI